MAGLFYLAVLNMAFDQPAGDAVAVQFGGHHQADGTGTDDQDVARTGHNRAGFTLVVFGGVSSTHEYRFLARPGNPKAGLLGF
jgi:hypothetical protein